MTHDEQKLLDGLLAVESGLTAWEMDFIENTDKSFRERSLSDEQRYWLNWIADKVGLGGLTWNRKESTGRRFLMS